jgi:hypothetical protein
LTPPVAGALLILFFVFRFVFWFLFNGSDFLAALADTVFLAALPDTVFLAAGPVFLAALPGPDTDFLAGLVRAMMMLIVCCVFGNNNEMKCEMKVCFWFLLLRIFV